MELMQCRLLVVIGIGCVASAATSSIPPTTVATVSFCQEIDGCIPYVWNGTTAEMIAATAAIVVSVAFTRSTI